MRLQIKTLEHSLTALSEGRYSQWDIYKCISYAEWLKRFNHITDKEWDVYYKYIMYILNGEFEEFISSHSFGGR